MISDKTGANRWEEAIAAFARALEIDPTNERARKMVEQCAAMALTSSSEKALKLWTEDLGRRHRVHAFM